MTEIVELLAELAPDLRGALRIAQRKAYVILDGTLARCSPSRLTAVVQAILTLHHQAG